MLSVNGTDKHTTMKFTKVKLVIDRVNGTLRVTDNTGFTPVSIQFHQREVISVLV